MSDLSVATRAAEMAETAARARLSFADAIDAGSDLTAGAFPLFRQASDASAPTNVLSGVLSGATVTAFDFAYDPAPGAIADGARPWFALESARHYTCAVVRTGRRCPLVHISPRGARPQLPDDSTAPLSDGDLDELYQVFADEPALVDGLLGSPAADLLRKTQGHFTFAIADDAALCFARNVKPTEVPGLLSLTIAFVRSIPDEFWAEAEDLAARGPRAAVLANAAASMTPDPPPAPAPVTERTEPPEPSATAEPVEPAPPAVVPERAPTPRHLRLRDLNKKIDGEGAPPTRPLPRDQVTETPGAAPPSEAHVTAAPEPSDEAPAAPEPQLDAQAALEPADLQPTPGELAANETTTPSPMTAASDAEARSVFDFSAPAARQSPRDQLRQWATDTAVPPGAARSIFNLRRVQKDDDATDTTDATDDVEGHVDTADAPSGDATNAAGSDAPLAGDHEPSDAETFADDELDDAAREDALETLRDMLMEGIITLEEYDETRDYLRGQ